MVLLCLLAGDGGGQRGGQLGAEVIQLLLQGQHRLDIDTYRLACMSNEKGWFK